MACTQSPEGLGSPQDGCSTLSLPWANKPVRCAQRGRHSLSKEKVLGFTGHNTTEEKESPYTRTELPPRGDGPTWLTGLLGPLPLRCRSLPVNNTHPFKTPDWLHQVPRTRTKHPKEEQSCWLDVRGEGWVWIRPGTSSVPEWLTHENQDTELLKDHVLPSTTAPIETSLGSRGWSAKSGWVLH